MSRRRALLALLGLAVGPMAGTWAGLLLAGCAPLPRRAAGSAAAMPSFADALARGLPFTVGVYAVEPGEANAAPARLTPLAAGAPAAGTERSKESAGADSGRGAGAADREAEADADDDAARADGGTLGAGFVLHADGLIATAAHVVAGATRIVVKLPDDRLLPARVLGIDTEADIALLQVDERWSAAPPLGHSVGLRPGDWVLAVGEPFGLQRTVVAGIVGGPARHFLEDRELVFIQSDLTLNPGHSGGPLLDAHGTIVGMNARAIAGAYGMAGMSLTVPIEVVLQIAAELRAGHRVARPRFGARFEDLLPPQAFAAGLTHARGAVLRALNRDGAAARLGLRNGDIVVGLNGQPVSDSAELARVLLDWSDPARLSATVFRDGRYRELRLPRPATDDGPARGTP